MTFLQIPREMQLEVLSFLKPHELEPVRLACRRFYRLAHDPALLSRIVEPNIRNGRFTLAISNTSTSPIRCIHADGNLIFTGHEDIYVRIWRCVKGAFSVTRELPGPSFTCAMCFENNDDHFFSGHSDGTIRVWSRRSFQHLQDIVGAPRGVLALMSEGSDLYAGFESGIRLWRYRGGKYLAHATFDHGKKYTHICLKKDFSFCAAADGAIDIFEKLIKVQTLNAHSAVKTVQFNGNFLLAGTEDGLMIWKKVDSRFDLIHESRLAYQQLCLTSEHLFVIPDMGILRRIEVLKPVSGTTIQMLEKYLESFPGPASSLRFFGCKLLVGSLTGELMACDFGASDQRIFDDIESRFALLAMCQNPAHVQLKLRYLNARLAAMPAAAQEKIRRELTTIPGPNTCSKYSRAIRNYLANEYPSAPQTPRWKKVLYSIIEFFRNFCRWLLSRF